MGAITAEDYAAATTSPRGTDLYTEECNQAKQQRWLSETLQARLPRRQPCGSMLRTTILWWKSASYCYNLLPRRRFKHSPLGLAGSSGLLTQRDTVQFNEAFCIAKYAFRLSPPAVVSRFLLLLFLSISIVLRLD